MDRNNIFTRTEKDYREIGEQYYNEGYEMSFWDFGKPIKCIVRSIFSYKESQLNNNRILNILNTMSKLLEKPEYGQLIKLKHYGYKYNLLVVSHKIHMTEGITEIRFELIPELNFNIEQCCYLLKCQGGVLAQLQHEINSILEDIKHPYRQELISRIKEVKTNWELIKQYKDLLPKDYYIKKNKFTNRYSVYGEYNKNISQRPGCVLDFKNLKEAIFYLWTVEKTSQYWVVTKSIKDIPKDIRLQIDVLTA